jgi:hypothetical protein
MRNLLQEHYGRLDYNSEQHYIRMTFSGAISEEEYRFFWDFWLKQAVALNCTNLLIDQRRIGKVSMKSRAWFLFTWLPKAKNRVKWLFSIGILASKSFMHKSGLDYMVRGARRVTGYDIRFFEKENEAGEWFATA